MATITNRDKLWTVRWRELSATIGADGVTERVWKNRRRACPDKATAEALKREEERAAALGEHWQDAREYAVATIGAVEPCRSGPKVGAQPANIGGTGPLGSAVVGTHVVHRMSEMPAALVVSVPMTNG